MKKFERVKEPTDSEPGLIRFHGERTVEGFYEPQPFVEEFNTVSREDLEVALILLTC